MGPGLVDGVHRDSVGFLNISNIEGLRLEGGKGTGNARGTDDFSMIPGHSTLK